MPVIPVAPRAREVGIPEMSPGMAGAPFAAVEKSAENVEALASYGSKIYRVISHAENATEVLKAKNQVQADINHFNESLSGIADYKAIPGLSENLKTELTKKYSEMLSDKPLAWNALSPYLDHHIMQAQHTAEMKRVKLFTDEGRANLVESLKRSAQGWATANIAERAVIEGDADLEIETAQMARLFSAQEVLKLKDKFHRDKEESDIIHKTRSNDPVLIQQGIDDLSDPKKYPYLDEKQKAIYGEAAERHLDITKKKIGQEEGELAVNASIGKLESKWQHPDGSFDFTAAEKDLQSSTFREENGLLDKNGNPNRKLINELETYLHAKNADTEKIKREGKDKEAEGVIQAIVGGKLGEASKLLKQSKFLKGTPEGLSLLNGIRTWGKRTDEDVSSHEDRKEYLNIQEQIDMGNYDAAKKMIVDTPHLKSSTAFALLNRLDNKELRDVNHGLSQANKYLSSQIAPSKGALLPSIPEETARAANAQQELQKWASDEKKKATEGKRIPLTTEEIFNKAKEIAPNYRMKIDEKVTSIKESLKSGKPSLWNHITGTSQYSQEDLEFTAKQHGISVDEVKKRLGVKDADRSSGQVSDYTLP